MEAFPLGSSLPLGPLVIDQPSGPNSPPISGPYAAINAPSASGFHHSCFSCPASFPHQSLFSLDQQPPAPLQQDPPWHHPAPGVANFPSGPPCSPFLFKNGEKDGTEGWWKMETDDEPGDGKKEEEENEGGGQNEARRGNEGTGKDEGDEVDEKKEGEEEIEQNRPRKRKRGQGTQMGRGRRGMDERRGQKPKDTFRDMIAMALEAKEENKATLTEIYEFIMGKYAYYGQGSYNGWKNSIRHNLSMGDYFRKLPKDPHGKAGKGHYWTFGKHYHQIRDRQQTKEEEKGMIGGCGRKEGKMEEDEGKEGEESEGKKMTIESGKKKKRRKEVPKKEAEKEDAEPIPSSAALFHLPAPAYHHHPSSSGYPFTPPSSSSSDFHHHHHHHPLLPPSPHPVLPFYSSSSSSFISPSFLLVDYLFSLCCSVDDHNPMAVVRPVISDLWWWNNKFKMEEQWWRGTWGEWGAADESETATDFSLYQAFHSQQPPPIPYPDDAYSTLPSSAYESSQLMSDNSLGDPLASASPIFPYSGLF